MLIEHKDSKRLINTTFKETGKVSAFRIEINKEGLYSAQTPVLETANAFLITDASGNESFLYTDEKDHFARMFKVPPDHVVVKEHLRDIVNPENLPEVGHIYREERERSDLQEKIKRDIAEKRAKDQEAARDYHGAMWEQMNTVNRRYGNIYNTHGGKEAYIQQEMESKGHFAYEFRMSGDAELPLLRDLESYTALTGHPFVPDLDDEGSSRERLAQLTEQLRDGLFLEAHDFLPDVREVKDFDEKTEVMLAFSLKDRHEREVAEVKVIFPESMEFSGCVAEPFVAEITYRDSGEVLEYEVDLDEDPLCNAFSTFLAKRYDDEGENQEWVIDPDSVAHRTATSPAEQQQEARLADFSEMREALDLRMIKYEMNKVPGIGEALSPHALALDKSLKDAPHPKQDKPEQSREIAEDSGLSP